MASLRFGLVRAAAMVVALTAASQSLSQSGHNAHGAHSGQAAAAAWANGDHFARALYAGMTRMHEDMLRPAPTGDADRDFLAMMIPHHEGAVEMARLLLIHGKDPLVRRLAEEIIASQQGEIEAMKARLQILSRGADPNPGGYPSLGGTRGR
jgi:uncharacterized protein (DUF305 family)